MNWLYLCWFSFTNTLITIVFFNPLECSCLKSTLLNGNWTRWSYFNYSTTNDLDSLGINIVCTAAHPFFSLPSFTPSSRYVTENIRNGWLRTALSVMPQVLWRHKRSWFLEALNVDLLSIISCTSKRNPHKARQLLYWQYESYKHYLHSYVLLAITLWIMSGVKRGCLLSQFLYLQMIDLIIKTSTSWESVGYRE